MFTRRVKISAFLPIFVLATPTALLAQSVPSSEPIVGAPTWVSPVRPSQIADETSSSGATSQPYLQVQYLEPIGATPVLELPSASGIAYAPPMHAHQIIQSPRIEYPDGQHLQMHPARSAKANVVSSNPLDPVPHLLHHHAQQVPPAVIPDAAQREVWKSPYSYGYFGASGTRRWTRHHGYRDRGKEWRLR